MALVRERTIQITLIANDTLFSLEIHYIIHQISATAFQVNSDNLQTRSEVTSTKKHTVAIVLFKPEVTLH